MRQHSTARTLSITRCGIQPFRSVSSSHWNRHVSGHVATGRSAQHVGPLSPLHNHEVVTADILQNCY